jgi:hypothetical protein
MADEQQKSVPIGAPKSRPATENIRELTDSTRQLFQAGERVTRNLEELERRAERATDWRTQIATRPWITAGLAVLCGVALWRVFR